MSLKPRSFFHNSLGFFSRTILMVILIFIALTYLSRTGLLNPLGVSIIISNSMEPSLRRMDMVVYINTNYTVGDVVVYCITPSHC
ncbi:MAG: hypothetical protein QXE81_06355, partial [Desulfurococcaceae archaeon]